MLTLTIIPGQVVPLIEFSLLKPAEISDANFLVIISHFTKLDLLQQYGERANSRMSTEITTIRESMNEGTDSAIIRYKLLQRFNSFATKFGVNYWEAVIYRTLVINIDLI